MRRGLFLESANEFIEIPQNVSHPLHIVRRTDGHCHSAKGDYDSPDHCPSSWLAKNLCKEKQENEKLLGPALSVTPRREEFFPVIVELRSGDIRTTGQHDHPYRRRDDKYDGDKADEQFHELVGLSHCLQSRG